MRTFVMTTVRHMAHKSAAKADSEEVSSRMRLGPCRQSGPNPSRPMSHEWGRVGTGRHFCQK